MALERQDFNRFNQLIVYKLKSVNLNPSNKIAKCSSIVEVEPVTSWANYGHGIIVGVVVDKAIDSNNMPFRTTDRFEPHEGRF